MQNYVFSLMPVLFYPIALNVIVCLFVVVIISHLVSTSVNSTSLLILVLCLFFENMINYISVVEISTVVTICIFP